MPSTDNTPVELATPPPNSEACRDCLIEAVIAVGAIVARADGRVQPAERLQVLAYLGRVGLLWGPRRGDVLGRFDAEVAALGRDPGLQRRRLARVTNPFVGGPWAGLILGAAEHVGACDGEVHPCESRAIAAIARALGLGEPPRPAGRLSVVPRP